MPKVLIVDDEKTNRLRLVKIVESLGFTALQASDGVRALIVLEDNPEIRCVITDCQMPNLDGPALIQEIRSRGAKYPILVYSAYRSVKEVAALLDQGADVFLNYPVTRENVGEYLQQLLFRMAEKAS